MDNKYIKIIKGTPLFHGMSDEEIAQFLRPDGSGIKSFRKESYIFHAGDKTAYFGILLEGKALIERDELWGGRSIIAPLEAGQLFGEVYACTGEPLGVSVCAKEQCTVLFLSPESIIKESSTLTARLLKITAIKNLILLFAPRHTFGLPSRFTNLTPPVLAPVFSFPGLAVLLCPHSSDDTWCRNFHLLSIGYVFRPHLRPRLTQSRSALLWKP